MSLRNILADVASDLGFRVQDTQQRERAISLINDAAKEIYENSDLVNCLREQIFEWPGDEQQVVLPWYVDTVRAVRNYESEIAIELLDMRPRYSTMGWSEDKFWRQLRIKQEQLALKRDLADLSKLTFTLPSGSPEAFTLTVVGKTATAQRISETLVFSAGDTTKTTVNLYESVELLEKNITTSLNITATDGDGNEVADIPNSELNSRYTLLNVLDRWQQWGQTRLVEILYKIKFTPFVNDYDVFPCGDIYDKSIYYKAVALWYAKQKDSDALKMAAAYDNKCEGDLTRIAQNKQSSIQMKIDFGSARWDRLTLRGYPRSVTGESYPEYYTRGY